MRIAAIVACMALVAAASRFDARAADRLNIVATTSDLASLASAVAGERANVKGICTGLEDPHVVQAKPSFIMMARGADLWIRVGLELEIGWERPIIDGSRNPRIRMGADGHLDASEGIVRLEVPTQKVDRAMGDVHPLGNPHYWLDPWNGRVVARAIRDRLRKLDRVHAAEYDANCAAFEERLDEAVFGRDLVARLGGDELWRMALDDRLDRELAGKGLSDDLDGWMGTMRRFRDSKIVTYHRSWVYFAERFGLDVVAELEPKPGIPPSPGHLAEVIGIARAQNVRAILVEPFYERKGPAFVAGKTGAVVVEAANSVGGQREAADYIAMIDNVVKRLSKALESAQR